MSKIFDLLIVGGGIAGTGLARDAALRGADVCLIEKNTLGSGTSSKSSKLIHGGIRYLELSWDGLKQGDFGVFWKNLRFVFLSLRECRILESIAPELIKPLPIVIPIYKNSPRKKLATLFGVLFYALLAFLSGGGLKWPIVYWNAKSLLKKIPPIKQEQLIGGALFWDRLTNDKELVLSIACCAKKMGAQILEREELTHYEYVDSVKAFKITTQTKAGEIKSYQARKLVNATGPWIDQCRKLNENSASCLVAPVGGCHIEIKKTLPVSVLLQATDKRIFFCINMQDRARIGTTETAYKSLDKLEPTPREVKYLIESYNHHFPNHAISKKDIVHSDAGIRPLFKMGKTKTSNSISRDHEIIQTESGIWNMVGVKLTDHRRAAQELMDTLVVDLQKFNPKIATHSKTSTTKI